MRLQELQKQHYECEDTEMDVIREYVGVMPREGVRDLCFGGACVYREYGNYEDVSLLCRRRYIQRRIQRWRIGRIEVIGVQQLRETRALLYTHAANPVRENDSRPSLTQ